MPDWLSWEFWAEAAHTPLLFWAEAAHPVLSGRAWAWYVANRKNIVPLATLVAQLATLVVAALVARAALAQARTAREQHEAQTTADRERRITESFAKAVEQLGSCKRETRLGGIYTLERIARESEREYWPIMETLTAFVRERAPVQAAAGQTRPPTDIQAVLTVLGCRDKKAWQKDIAEKRSLNLSETDLRGANLRGMHFENADFTITHLEDADLGGAHLDGADFTAAHLDRALLDDAHLRGAHLNGAQLNGADLSGADLQEAKGLTQEQVNSAQCEEDDAACGAGGPYPPAGGAQGDKATTTPRASVPGPASVKVVGASTFGGKDIGVMETARAWPLIASLCA